MLGLNTDRQVDDATSRDGRLRATPGNSGEVFVARARSGKPIRTPRRGDAVCLLALAVGRERRGLSGTRTEWRSLVGAAVPYEGPRPAPA